MPVTSTLQLDTTVTYDDSEVVSTTDDEDTVLTTPVHATEGADRSTSTAFTHTGAPSNRAIPVPVFVGTLVGVIAFLILLAVTVVIIIVFMKKYKEKRTQGDEDHGYDYVTDSEMKRFSD